jgi:superfamily II DNA/RNA helicase
LAVAASDPELVNATVEEIVRLGANRKSWLVFASGINHAGMLKEQFEVHGIEVDLVTGEDGKNKRNSTLAKFKSGQTRCLINVNVLTTGFDAPSVDIWLHWFGQPPARAYTSRWWAVGQDWPKARRIALCWITARMSSGTGLLIRLSQRINRLALGRVMRL